MLKFLKYFPFLKIVCYLKSFLILFVSKQQYIPEPGNLWLIFQIIFFFVKMYLIKFIYLNKNTCRGRGTYGQFLKL